MSASTVFRIEPINLHSALQFVDRKHSHLDPPIGGLFALAAWVELECTGVAIVGRPVARLLDDGTVAEVTRVATDGVRGACSALVRAAGKEAVARGYTRVVSYTILGETGACYRAARWWPTDLAGGGEWSNDKRPRKAAQQPVRKVRWEFGPAALPRSMEAWEALRANVGLTQIRAREVPDAEPLLRLAPVA